MYIKFQIKDYKPILAFDTECPVKEHFEDYYCFRTRFDIVAYAGEVGECAEGNNVNEYDHVVIGQMSVRVVDEMLCLDDGIPEEVATDAVDSDTYLAISTAINTERHKRLSADKEWQPLLTVYLETLYILPKYRNRGVGSFIWDNLGEILRIYLNREIHTVAVIPKPMCLSGETMTEKEKAKMLKLMLRRMNHAGFQKIRNSEVYMRNYAEK